MSEDKAGDPGQRAPAAPTTSSKLFYPFRALGVITDGVPFVLTRLGDECFITASIGRSFQVFRCDHLRTVLVAPPTHKRIACLAVKGSDARFVASGRNIHVWVRLACQGLLGSHPGNVVRMLCLGDVLVTVCDQGCLKSWNIARAMPEGEAQMAEMRMAPDFGTPTALSHPATYLNKVLVASDRGRLQLWNVRSRKRIHDFKCLRGEGSAERSPEVPVRCVEPSPALDVAAVGLQDGRVLLVNLKTDRLLFSFTQSTPVTALSFRTDAGSAATPMLASGGTDGEVALWDLAGRKLHCTMSCHADSVTQLEFLPQEPVLASGSPDNTLKMWVFDSPDGTARLLRARGGHRLPPRGLQYYGNTTLASMGEGNDATALCLLSAGGEGAFRMFHTVRDQLSRELSQKALAKIPGVQHHPAPGAKFVLPPIVAFAANETRARDWGNILTCHESDCNGYVWSYRRLAACRQVLRQAHWESNAMSHPPNPKDFATCVAISACGNFGLVGTQGGAVYKYNMQSGQPRGSYPTSATPKRKGPRALGGAILKPGHVGNLSADVKGKSRGVEEADGAAAAGEQGGHTASVQGVAVDAMNLTTITAGLDGQLMFWDFTTHKVSATVGVGVGITRTELVRDTGLLAAACQDFVVRMYDIVTRRLVRRLAGHSGAISAMCFTPDARRLATTADDRSLRVWDLPTGKCVDWMQFKKAAAGVTMSPSGEFMATSHKGRLGISVWADKSFFQPVYLDASPKEPVLMDEPAPVADEEGDVQDHNDEAILVDQEGAFKGKDKRAIRGARAGGAVEDEDGGPEDGGGPMDIQEPAEPKAEGAITLSALPRSYWAGLFQLEQVKARNRPIEPPKKPERAPFFLPTIHKDGDAAPSFPDAPPPSSTPAAALEGGSGFKEADPPGWGDVWSDDDVAEAEGATGDGADLPVHTGAGGKSKKAKKRKRQEEHTDEQGDTPADQPPPAEDVPPPPVQSRIMTSKSKDRARMLPPRCKMAALLEGSRGGGQGYSEVMDYLMTLGPPSVDVEMSLLCQGEFDEEGLGVLDATCDMLLEQIGCRRNFEVVQAYLHRFLKLYADIMMTQPALKQKARLLKASQEQSSRRLRELVQHNLCLVQYFSNIQT